MGARADGGERRAVAYIRVEAAGPVGASPDVAAAAVSLQRSAIESWAARERVDVTSYRVDVGVAGDAPIVDRPGLLSAYRAIVSERAGILVAANAARFSLDELVSWLIERAALTQGATLLTADGSRAPERRAAASLRARVPVAEQPAEGEGWSRGALELARAHQRVVVRERIRASLAERRSRGERVGNVPFGYRLAADGVHLEVDPREQAIVEEVRRLRASGLSQRAIAAELEASGVRGRTGAPLRQTQVATILKTAS